MPCWLVDPLTRHLFATARRDEICSQQVVFLDQLCPMLNLGCKIWSERTVWYLGIKVDDAIDMAATIDI